LEEDRVSEVQDEAVGSATLTSLASVRREDAQGGRWVWGGENELEVNFGTSLPSKCPANEAVVHPDGLQQAGLHHNFHSYLIAAAAAFIRGWRHCTLQKVT
jgi:hypothetical protein